jgi:hypothetical protein
MSEAIFNRGINRELKIWTPFTYHGAPFNARMKGDRSVIFGLYAATYKHGFNYLEDIESEDLQKLIDIYNMNMNQLDGDQQALILEIAAKEYVKNVEMRIRNLRLDTKERRIDAANEEIDYRIDALKADNAELETKRIQIDLEKEKADMEIREIESKIRLEEIEQDFIDIEISNKQIDLARTEARILDSALKALNIQLAIVQVGLEITETDVRKTNYQADIAKIYADIAQKELGSQGLAVDEAELAAFLYSIERLSEERSALITDKGAIITQEITNIASQKAKESELEAAMLEEEGEKKTARRTTLELKKESALDGKNISQREDDMAEDIAADGKVSKMDMADKKTEIPDARITAALNAANAAIEAATKLAAANIVNTLTHELGIG